MPGRAPNGIAVNASVQLSGVDGTALRYRNLAMPAGRASMQMTLASQGRSAPALTGALSGSGTVTLESARIAGLDPRAFEVAVRASDSGQSKDDARLKQIVEPALSAGALSVGSAQIPFTIRDGRLRVGATTLDANGVRATVSGGYDIPADQADIRAALALTHGRTRDRPSRNPVVRGRHARRAQPQRRRRGAVVLAGGAGDRSRNQKAGCDRARRTTAADARAGIAAAAGGCATRAAGDAAERAADASADPRPRPAPASGQAKDRRAASAGRAARDGRACANSPGAGDGPAAGGAAAATDRREAGAGRRRKAEAEAAAGADAAGCQSAAAPGAAEQQLAPSPRRQPGGADFPDS